MTVDPKWGVVFNAVSGVLAVLLGVAWYTILPTKDAATLMSILSGANVLVNGILHGISAPVPGPITKLMNRPAS